MSLDTLDRTPPPIFRQGTSALTKMVLFAALAVFLMAADTRFGLTPPLRSALATALLPVQQALRWPVWLYGEASVWVAGMERAREDANSARAQLARQAARIAQVETLAAENLRLRTLLDLRPALTVRSVSAEVLYEAADPYSRKVFIDRGARDEVHLGSPVINAAGVLGQVTALYPMSALVTLMTDRDAAIPVINTRTQQRSAAFGGAEGGTALELRFVTANADVQLGDELVTSGIDGVYPEGLAVGKVARVDRRTDAGFARIVITPAANIDGVRHLLVLEPLGLQKPPRPDGSASPTPQQKAAAMGAAAQRASAATPASAASRATAAPASSAQEIRP